MKRNEIDQLIVARATLTNPSANLQLSDSMDSRTIAFDNIVVAMMMYIHAKHNTDKVHSAVPSPAAPQPPPTHNYGYTSRTDLAITELPVLSHLIRHMVDKDDEILNGLFDVATKLYNELYPEPRGGYRDDNGDWVHEDELNRHPDDLLE